MNYQIELMDGSAKKWSISQSATIGADETCQIQIPQTGIHDRHCRIEARENKLFIKDLRTEGGTFVNGARILEAELNDGDWISVGPVDFVVHDMKKIKKNFTLSSKCSEWNQTLQSLVHVSQSDHSVLLLGPSGTGQDILAKNIHENSNRKNQPLLSVNCSALTETLVESELFGHIKGSFTGAISDRKGAFEAARGGTLFLDEIGDLPYPLQAKLLRAIENAEIRPVGSDKIIKTDVRIIAATHQNLLQKIREGQFRADLYYRLNIITIEVPSLHQRMDDFEDFLYQFAKESRIGFSYLAIQKLKKYSWPGNIRELKNLIARAATLFPKCYIQESHVDQLLNRNDLSVPDRNLSSEENFGAQNSTATLSVIKEIEKQMILKRLQANNGSQKNTARDLGMPKSTLHDKLKTYGIDIKKINYANSLNF